MRLIRMRRSSILATICLARSAEFISIASIKPMPRTSTTLSCFAARSCSWRLKYAPVSWMLREQIFLLDGVDDGDGHRASQRTAAEGGSVQPGMDGARRFLRAQHGAQRQAARQRLGQRGDIRLNAKVLVGTPFAGTPQAGLNFIRDEQRAGRLRKLARGSKKFLRHRPDAALALDRLRSRWRKPRSRSWPADDPHR